MLSKAERNRAAASMRALPTAAEAMFKDRLCQFKSETGIGFDHQAIIGFFIADFCIPSRMLIVEIDGSSHIDRQEYDADRDAFLRRLGFTVLRIDNEDVSSFDLRAVAAMPKVDGKLYARALRQAKMEWRDALSRQRFMERKIVMYSKYDKYNPNMEYMPSFNQKLVAKMKRQGIIPKECRSVTKPPRPRDWRSQG